MYKPSCSSASFPPEEMETDSMETDTISRIRIPCRNCMELSYGLEIIASDMSYFGTNLRAVVAETERLIKDFLKRRRIERRYVVAQRNKIYDVDEESSLSSSEDELYLDNYAEPINDEAQSSRGRNRGSRSTFGAWLIISFVKGGWSYNTTKSYLFNEFGLKCTRSRTTPERLSLTGVYKAIIKFETSEELKQVVVNLRENRVNNKFLFLSFDKRPLVQDFSESDSDDSRNGYLVPIARPD